MYSGGPTALAVGSITLFDSFIRNTKVAVRTGYTNSSQPPAGNSLILENIRLSNVPVAVEGGNNRTVLQGTPVNDYISAWGEGMCSLHRKTNRREGLTKIRSCIHSKRATHLSRSYSTGFKARELSTRRRQVLRAFETSISTVPHRRLCQRT